MQYYISQTCDREQFEARKVAFSLEFLKIFAYGCSFFVTGGGGGGSGGIIPRKIFKFGGSKTLFSALCHEICL